MYHTYSIAVIISIILVEHHCTQAVGHFTKRNGYVYKIPSSPHHPASNTIYEVSSSEAALIHDGISGGDVDVEYKSESGTAVQDYGSDGGGHKAGYSIGSGLRSIAQGSAHQAHSAVTSQHAAAEQAAFVAKNTLAQAATQAAATAQAALEGKHVLLEELQQQTTEAQKALTRELEQLKTARLASKLAQQTAQSANNHVAELTAALNNAKSVSEQAEQTATEVANQLASQSAMVGQAKGRLEHLEERLKQASVDFEATKDAAWKATASAAEAQVNASKAAAHATLGLHESAQQQQQQHHIVNVNGNSYEH